MDADRSPAQLAELEKFCQEHYRDLIRITMYVGATMEQAKDAASGALEDLVRNWGHIRDPLKWTRRAAISHFLKEKERGLDRVRNRLALMDGGSAQSSHDPQTLWEEQEWVTQILRSLPPKQSEAMYLITKGFKPAEIGVMLGRTPAAVRQNLHEARKRLKHAIQQQQAGDQRVGSTASTSRKRAG